MSHKYGYSSVNFNSGDHAVGDKFTGSTRECYNHGGDAGEIVVPSFVRESRIPIDFQGKDGCLSGKTGTPKSWNNKYQKTHHVSGRGGFLRRFVNHFHNYVSDSVFRNYHSIPRRNYSQEYSNPDSNPLQFYGHKRSTQKRVLLVLYLLLTLGFGYLLMRYILRVRLFFMSVMCPIDEADKIVVRQSGYDDEISVVKRVFVNMPLWAVFPLNERTYPLYKQLSAERGESIKYLRSQNLGWIRYFDYMHSRYIYNEVLHEFECTRFWCDERWQNGSKILTNGEISDPEKFHSASQGFVFQGLSNQTAEAYSRLFGPNFADIHVDSVFALTVKEFLTPFSVFQILSMIIWFLDDYFQYALCVAILMIFSVGYNVYKVRSSLMRMKEMVKFSCSVSVFRGGSWMRISSIDLVPGDLYLVDNDIKTAPCDSVLLTGICVVDESLLTGEGMPLSKTHISDEVIRKYNPWDQSLLSPCNKKVSDSTLFAGSRIIKSRGGVSPKILKGCDSADVDSPVALVIRTGFNTMNGTLLRLVLYPQSIIDVEFYRDSFKFIGLLFIISLMGLAYALSIFLRIKDMETKRIVFRVLDIFTVTVPPALPATLSVGTGFAIRSLYKKKVHCFNPPRVPVAGRIDMVIFDKTGTITESNLGICGIQASISIGELPSKSKGEARIKFHQTGSERGLDYNSEESSDVSFVGDPVIVEENEIYFRGTTEKYKDIFSDGDGYYDNDGCLIDEFSPIESQSSRFVQLLTDISAFNVLYSLKCSKKDGNYGSYGKSDIFDSFVSLPGIVGTERGLDGSISSDLLNFFEKIPRLMCCISSCHSMSLVNGNLIGDFMDLEMFNFTRWKFHEYTKSEINRLRHVSSSKQGQGYFSPISTGGDMPTTLESLFSRGKSPVTVVSPFYLAMIRPKYSDTHSGTCTDDSDLDIDDDDEIPAVLFRVELTIVKRFEFSSELRRMGTIVKKSVLYKNINLRDFQMGGDKRNVTVNANKVFDETDHSYEGFQRYCFPSYELFTKGASENIRAISKPNSIPPDFDERLGLISRNGYRVIACAAKVIQNNDVDGILNMNLTELEEDSNFLGFVVFENKPKEDSLPTMDALKEARIDKVMCTGDNIIAAISVGRQCNLIDPRSIVFCPHFVEKVVDGEKQKKIMWEDAGGLGIRLDPHLLVPTKVANIRKNAMSNIASTTQKDRRFSRTSTLCPSMSAGVGENLLMSHPNQKEILSNYCLAVTGEFFAWILENEPEDVIEKIILMCKIYARMLPHQKLALVERQQNFGRHVLFVGDGANDMAALRASDAGLSLSANESSIAAPFMTTCTSPKRTLDLISCGRSALVTSFGCFKFMALYPLIQFLSVLALYTMHSELSNPELLITDIVLVLPLAVSISSCSPNPKIHNSPPETKLVSPKVLCSILGQVIIQMISQFALYKIMSSQISPDKSLGLEDGKWIETQPALGITIFCNSMFIYLAGSLVFCAGPPHKQKIWKCHSYTVIFCLGFALSMSFSVLSYSERFAEIIESNPLEPHLRVYLLACSFITFVAMLVYEKFISSLLAEFIKGYFKRLFVLRFMKSPTKNNAGETPGSPSLSIFGNLFTYVRALSSKSVNPNSPAYLEAKVSLYRSQKKRYLACREIMDNIKRKEGLDLVIE